MRTELACHNKLCSYDLNHTETDFHLQVKKYKIGNLLLPSR
ncbi:hypothetical protein SAMN02745165_01918 [Malonomonas rubra DSM 5091]|uniref:Uncharacterized protein n=1 Tax=Malonomonas rubra DSM 5091 TaxID=1122189 RepID=A0A1M6HY19_MALRU|nr:hypothetical protein SAMN02745165_01918 [Malonomonas rubra DSM 5091]